MVACGSRSLCTAACSPFLMLPVKVDGEKREREAVAKAEEGNRWNRGGPEGTRENRRGPEGNRGVSGVERQRERRRDSGRNRRCTGGDRCTSSVLRDSWRAINRVFRGFGKPAATLPQTWPPEAAPVPVEAAVSPLLASALPTYP